MKSLATFLPSKQFRGVLLSLVFAAVLIGGSVAARRPHYVDTPSAPLLVVDKSADMLAQIPRDDWQDIFAKTHLAASETSSSAKSVTDPALLTPTDIIARDLFSKYVAASQTTGSALDTKTQGDIVKSVLGTENSVSRSPRLYTEGDVIVVEDDSAEVLRAYGNTIGTSIKSNWRQSENELDIYNRALQNNNEKELQKLTPIIENYKKTLDEALTVSVPRNALQTHLEFLNALSRLVFSLNSMQNTFKDPLTAMNGFGLYPKAMSDLQRSLKDARDLFSRNNVVFNNATENGNYFARYIDLVEQVQKELQKI